MAIVYITIHGNVVYYILIYYYVLNIMWITLKCMWTTFTFPNRNNM